VNSALRSCPQANSAFHKSGPRDERRRTHRTGHRHGGRSTAGRPGSGRASRWARGAAIRTLSHQLLSVLPQVDTPTSTARFAGRDEEIDASGRGCTGCIARATGATSSLTGPVAYGMCATIGTIASVMLSAGTALAARAWCCHCRVTGRTRCAAATAPGPPLVRNVRPVGECRLSGIPGCKGCPGSVARSVAG